MDARRVPTNDTSAAVTRAGSRRSKLDSEGLQLSVTELLGHKHGSSSFRVVHDRGLLQGRPAMKAATLFPLLLVPSIAVRYLHGSGPTRIVLAMLLGVAAAAVGATAVLTYGAFRRYRDHGDSSGSGSD
jgi:hypothetical protein